MADTAQRSPEDQISDLLKESQSKTTDQLKALLTSTEFKKISEVPQDPNSAEYIDWYYKNKDSVELVKKNAASIFINWGKFLSVRWQKMPTFDDEAVQSLNLKIETLKTILDTILVNPGAGIRIGFQEKELTPKESIIWSDFDKITRTNIWTIVNEWYLGTDASANPNGYWLITLDWKKYVVKTIKSDSDKYQTNPVYVAEVGDVYISANDDYNKLKLELGNLTFKKAELDNSSLSSTWSPADLWTAAKDVPYGTLSVAWTAEAILIKLWAMVTRAKWWSVDMPHYKDQIVKWLNTIPGIWKLGSHNIGKAIILTAVVAVLTNIFFFDRDLARWDLASILNNKGDKSALIKDQPNWVATTQRSQNANLAELLKKLQ